MTQSMVVSTSIHGPCVCLLKHGFERNHVIRTSRVAVAFGRCRVCASTRSLEDVALKLLVAAHQSFQGKRSSDRRENHVVAEDHLLLTRLTKWNLDLVFVSVSGWKHRKHKPARH